MSLAYLVSGVNVFPFHPRLARSATNRGNTWPRQDIDILLNKQVPDYTCNVWPCVVLLQSDVILMSLYEGYHMTLNNFISIAYAGEISIDNL